MNCGQFAQNFFQAFSEHLITGVKNVGALLWQGGLQGQRNQFHHFRYRAGSAAVGTASQEHQIMLLWQAIEKLSCQIDPNCVPDDATREETFEADKLNELVGK